MLLNGPRVWPSVFEVPAVFIQGYFSSSVVGFRSELLLGVMIAKLRGLTALGRAVSTRQKLK